MSAHKCQYRQSKMTISSQPVDDILTKRHPSKQPRTKPHKQLPIHTRRPMQKTPSPFIQQPRIKHSADSHSTRQNAQKKQENKRIYKLSTDYLQSNAKKKRNFAADNSHSLSAADESAANIRTPHTSKVKESNARAMPSPEETQTNTCAETGRRKGGSASIGRRHHI